MASIARHTIACVGVGLALSGCAMSYAPDRADYVGRGRDGTPSEVYAESRYGGATITAPVRRAAAHDRLEVRLPGGTWVDCHISCSETLRRETVDFWQNHSGTNGVSPDGPGYLYWRR